MTENSDDVDAQKEFDRRIGQFGYKYVEPLGKGSSGFVIRARPVSKSDESEDVAIKFIPLTNIVKDAIFRKKLRREISIQRLLDHENLVKLIEAYKDKRYMYLIIELARDGDLFEKISNSPKRFEEEEIFGYFRQIVDGLEYLHDKMISHRDLKLENILIFGNTLKICDFGLSVILGPNKLAESFVGSLEYVSPEILEGKGEEMYDGCLSDIFSLGVVLYCMCTGEMPYDGDNRKPSEEVLMFRNPIDGDLEDLIRRMMHPEPEKRINLEDIRNHAWWVKMELKTGNVKRKKNKKKKKKKLEAFKLKSKKNNSKNRSKRTLLQNSIYKEQQQEEEEGEKEEEEEEDHLSIQEKELDSGVGKRILSLLNEIGVFFGKKLNISKEEIREKLVSEEKNREKVYYKLVKKKVAKGELVSPVSLKFDEEEEDEIF